MQELLAPSVQIPVVVDSVSCPGDLADVMSNFAGALLVALPGLGTVFNCTVAVHENRLLISSPTIHAMRDEHGTIKMWMEGQCCNMEQEIKASAPPCIMCRFQA